MRHRIRIPSLALVLVLLLQAPIFASVPQSDVVFHGHEVLRVAAANGMTSEQRAAVISERLANGDRDRAAIRIEPARKGPVLMLGDVPLLLVTPEDAELARSTPEALAEEWKARLESERLPTPEPGPTPWNSLWTNLRHLLALLAMLLGGAIAAWLINWGAARVAEQPQRYALRVSGAVVTVVGALLTLAVALATVAASLAYLPGVQSFRMTGLLVGLGAMGLIASAELLGNLAGGAVVALASLYKVGDYVRIGGHAGRVERIGVCFTRLETERHGARLVPNSATLRRGVAFTSPSHSALLSLPVRLAYTVEQELAQALIVEAALRTQGLVDEPFPECFLAELEDDGVRFELRAWLAKGERTEAVRSRFHVNLLDVLAENGLGPSGAPQLRAKLRIGMASDSEFSGL